GGRGGGAPADRGGTRSGGTGRRRPVGAPLPQPDPARALPHVRIGDLRLVLLPDVAPDLSPAGARVRPDARRLARGAPAPRDRGGRLRRRGGERPARAAG